MAKSRARIEDLQWLADHLDGMADSSTGRETADQLDRLNRLQDWMSVMIDARVARLTQPEPAHHAAMMQQFDAAVAKWRREREDAASDYAGDLAIFDAQHTKPTLKSFMIGQAQRAEQVARCDCPVTITHSVHCPLSPDFVSADL